jgi:thioredoxin-dependent peroxiredoxin
MINTPAPDFSLEASIGQNVTLADLRGSFVILIFYPANDTPTCNRQLDEMSIGAEKLLHYNVRVFGVNTASAEKAKEFCLRRRLEFPILSDPGGRVARKYGAQMSWLAFNKRTVVGIDPNGTIVFYERGTPSPEHILQAIQIGTELSEARG